MTRETKVGLLIGLGLILLIGIIVSDYLSVAQMQEPAALTEFGPRAGESIRNDRQPSPAALAETAAPVSNRRQTIPTPQEMGPPSSGPAQPQARPDAPIAQGPTSPAYVPLLSSTARTTPTPVEPTAEAIPTPAEMTLSELAPPPPAFVTRQAPVTPVDTRDRASLAGRETPTSSGSRPVARVEPPVSVPTPHPSRNTIVHHVQEGETLFEIAQKYYGDGEQWPTIARANPERVMEGGNVREGVRLMLPAQPDDNVQAVVNAANQALQTRATVSTSSRTVKVASGDTLIGLARKHLGDGGRWKELLAANRGKLDGPQDLRVGMELNLPASGSALASAPVTVRSRSAAAKTYTVRSGDNLYRIAEKALGDGDRWQDIYQANRDALESPDSIRVGQTLKLPS